MSVAATSTKTSTNSNLRERTRGWLNAVNLHWAGVGILALVSLYLLIQMGFAWKLANSQNAEALAQQQIQLKAAEIAAKPLQGLDVKLAGASAQSDMFYVERLPVSYSEIAGQLGVLKTKSNVRLSRVNYTQPAPTSSNGKKATEGPGGTTVPSTGKDQLTEVLMDASLTGDYRSLVQFINGLERDKVFFLINGITLTGQQTGQVSLRIRIVTFLRGYVPADEADKASDSTASDIDKMVEDRAKRAGQGGPR
jgi:type IV pilus assembly protein PilO